MGHPTIVILFITYEVSRPESYMYAGGGGGGGGGACSLDPPDERTSNTLFMRPLHLSTANQKLHM